MNRYFDCTDILTVVRVLQSTHKIKCVHTHQYSIPVLTFVFYLRPYVNSYAKCNHWKKLDCIKVLFFVTYVAYWEPVIM